MKAGNQFRMGGMTLIELLVVIAIIGILSSIVISSLGQARGKARNSLRISVIQQIEKALTLYFDDHSYYPPATQTNLEGFSYEARSAAGACLGPGSLADIRIDDSADGMFIPALYSEGLFGMGDWNDPLEPSLAGDRFNCRYITSCDPTCSEPTDYYLHCTMEPYADAGRSDQGNHDEAFEVMSVDKWICLIDIPS